MTSDLRIHLDTYHGPLDLLLYLVRKEELEVAELPLASITQQFLDFVALLEQLDLDEIGDYIELAAHLIELKSRIVLPQHEEVEQEIEDPHEDLVQRLLEFKQYRDAAALLEACDAEQRLRFSRLARDTPERRTDPAEQPLEAVELWDLVSAFGRVMRDNLAPPETTSIRYDETPVHVYMGRIYKRLEAEREVYFTSLFPTAVHKSTLVATFLAVLELVRHRHALADQPTRYGDMLIKPGAEPYRGGLVTSSSDDAAPAGE
ncbi:Segregation and condensation protein A [Posidoniimonas polymericola]|uniref:Segregation and condensation protein A n=1 Tax=Posidoniimonas polymericola TaxID=2528002 RepID=A0A5C5YHZ1_9BACT|nr:segregation/condensation protein A [Posidoniimonas polymericola]TWT73752.1 Segregation and condensation protein A [Posidoniimonas polymericola]